MDRRLLLLPLLKPAGVLVVVALGAMAASIVGEATVRRRFERSGSDFESLLARWPPTAASTSARRLEELASPLGLEIAVAKSPARARPTTSEKTRSMASFGALGTCVDHRLTRADDDTPPIPGVVSAFVDLHRMCLLECRRHVLGSPDHTRKWEPDTLLDGPIPALVAVTRRSDTRAVGRDDAASSRLARYGGHAVGARRGRSHRSSTGPLRRRVRRDPGRAGFADRAGGAARRREKLRAALELELSRIESDLQRLTEILPPRMEGDAFVAAVRSHVESQRVTVTENGFRADPEGNPRKGELSVVWKGPEEKLIEVVPRIKKWALLVWYREVERGEGWRLATLTMHSAPLEKPEPESTGRRPPPVWLPPFPALLSTDRHRMEELRASVSRRSGLYALVRWFESREERLESLVNLTVELKAKIDPEGAETVAPPPFRAIRPGMDRRRPDDEHPQGVHRGERVLE